MDTGQPASSIAHLCGFLFVFDDLQQGIDIFDGKEVGNIYSRFGNPTVDSVASKIARLESIDLEQTATGLLTSSGMSAIALVAMGMLQPGDTLLTHPDLYGGTVALFRDVLQPLGIQLLTTDLRDDEGLVALLEARSDIRMIYCETPSNPLLRCIDLGKIAAFAKAFDCHTLVDNTFATPVLQRPLALGVDFVIHSTTKYLNGHGTGTGGVVVSLDMEAMQSRLLPKLRLLGGTASPWEAWLIHNGMKTLPLRMERHSQNAEIIANMLEKHPRVKSVHYPGLISHPDYELAQRQMQAAGGMLSFDLGGRDAAIRFVNALQLCTLTPTLGDVDTLVIHPATMSHRALAPEVRAALGISDGLVRLSVGIEDVADLLSDLVQALEVV
ncbi:MAG: PLP-dependent aspartate aminotransferase family protein [Saprospiraceae bacterium]